MTGMHIVSVMAEAEWVDRAACAGRTTSPANDLWYADTGLRPGPRRDAAVREAKAVCASCPVRNDCLLHALAQDEEWGIWGGATSDERARMKGKVA